MTNKKAELELLSPPGDTIEETLQMLRMSKGRFAKSMMLTMGEVESLIDGKLPIDLRMSHGLENTLGIDATFWRNRERNYRKKLASLNVKPVGRPAGPAQKVLGYRVYTANAAAIDRLVKKIILAHNKKPLT